MHPPTHSNSSAKNSDVTNDDDRQADCETGEPPKDMMGVQQKKEKEEWPALEVLAERAAICRSPGLGRYLMQSPSSNGGCDARTTLNNKYRGTSSEMKKRE